MLLLIDNYDSFTYNLVHYFGELGADVVVRRNDKIDVQEAMGMGASGIVLSPGPCDPAQAGICLGADGGCRRDENAAYGRLLGASNHRRSLWRKGRALS